MKCFLLSFRSFLFNLVWCFAACALPAHGFYMRKRKLQHDLPSPAFLAALAAQRAAAPAPESLPPPATRKPPTALSGYVYDAATQRHWPVDKASKLSRLAPMAPVAAVSLLTLLRDRECGLLPPPASSCRLLQSALAACVRAWEPSAALQVCSAAGRLEPLQALAAGSHPSGRQRSARPADTADARGM